MSNEERQKPKSDLLCLPFTAFQNQPEGVTGVEAVREMLDLLRIGQEVNHIQWSPSKRIELP